MAAFIMRDKYKDNTMANFHTHFTVACVVSAAASLVIYKAGMVSGSEFVLCAVTGTVGGLLPDIDLDHSLPARVGFSLLSMLVAFGLVIYWSPRLSLVALCALGLVVYVVMRYGVLAAFSRLTVHRGIVHSLPYMAVLALGLVYVSFFGLKNGAVVSWFLGAFLWFGALVHLLLDEIYSVNIFGLRLKKSFGTALKVFERKHARWYMGLYVLLAVMLVFAPPFTLFWQTLTDPISWRILHANLLPTF